jgi:hypothetical protein
MEISRTFVVMGERDLSTGYARNWFPNPIWTIPGDAYDRLECLRTLYS